MRIFLSLLALSLSLTACGAGRTVMNVKSPASPAASADAQAFKLVKVEDARGFELKPAQADIPSLNEADLNDAALRSRAYGRKRGSFGKARGDFMLPEASSVQALVSSCVGAALATAGGVLVTESDPRYASARPVEVRVDRFWSWLRPGAWVVAVEFDATLFITAPLPGFEQGRAVTGHAEMRRPAMTPERWASVVEQGLVALTENLSRELAPAVVPAAAVAEGAAPAAPAVVPAAVAEGAVPAAPAP